MVKPNRIPEKNPLTYEELCAVWKRHPSDGEAGSMAAAAPKKRLSSSAPRPTMNREEVARKFEALLDSLRQLLNEREDSARSDQQE